MATERPQGGPERCCQRSIRFYAHLVIVTAVQLAVLVAALARHAIGRWTAGVLLVAGLGLAAHAAVTLAPRLRRS